MWFKVKSTNEELNPNGKNKIITRWWLVDSENFAEAGYAVMKELNGDGEVEDVSLIKNMKPIANDDSFDKTDCKVFIIKIVEDYPQDDGTTKEMKYLVPAYAKSNDDLQDVMKNYLSQGLESMRITTIQETKYTII